MRLISSVTFAGCLLATAACANDVHTVGDVAASGGAENISGGQPGTGASSSTTGGTGGTPLIEPLPDDPAPDEPVPFPTEIACPNAEEKILTGYAKYGAGGGSTFVMPIASASQHRMKIVQLRLGYCGASASNNLGGANGDGADFIDVLALSGYGKEFFVDESPMEVTFFPRKDEGYATRLAGHGPYAGHIALYDVELDEIVQIHRFSGEITESTL